LQQLYGDCAVLDITSRLEGGAEVRISVPAHET
jgi:hypothetical protein